METHADRTRGTRAGLITLFTPSFADEANTNAQNLTAKEIVSRLPSDQFRVLMLSDGIPDPRIAARENTVLWRCSKHGNAAQWLARTLAARPDVYFFPREGPLDRMFLAVRRHLRLRTALVTYVVTSLRGIPITPVMTEAIRQADVVIGNSEYVSETTRERFGRETGTIHDGIRQDLFVPRPHATQPSKLTVLYVGSLQPMKRTDVCIREAARRPDVNFRIVGQGVEEPKCRALMSKLGCSNVVLAGHLSQAEVAREMQNADVFLFPSVVEGHPQVLGQAASCGLPAIAMDVYRPDYIVNGETGYLVSSDGELTQKLDLLLGDSALRHRMSLAAVQRALHFDWDTIAAQWAKVFKEAVHLRRRLQIYD